MNDGTWLVCPVQVTQMKYRLSEGSGECFYYIGAPAAAGLCMVLLCTYGFHVPACWLVWFTQPA